MSVTVGRNAKYPEERTGSDPIAWQKSAEGVVIRDVGRASETARKVERRGERIGPTGNGGRRPEQVEWHVGIATRERNAAENPAASTGLHV